MKNKTIKIFGIGAAVLFLLMALMPTTAAVDAADEVLFDDDTKPVGSGPGDGDGIIQIFVTIYSTSKEICRRLMDNTEDMIMGIEA